MPALFLPAVFGLAWFAQSPAPPLAARPAVTVAIEQRLEHDRFRFDGPSNFDTVELVPHSYEQRYTAGPTWLVVTGDYRVLGLRASTSARFAPQRTTAGSDIDTFFQTSGDVVTSGTAGEVTWRAFSVEQRLHLEAGEQWTAGVLLGYRRSRATFLPADIVVTHTAPATETRTFTTDRESTVARLVTSGLFVEWRRTLPRGWTMAADLDARPIVRARLVTSLPDKYDHDVVNDALSFGAGGRLGISRPVSRVSLGAAITLDGAWAYRSSAGYSQRGVGVEIFVKR